MKKLFICMLIAVVFLMSACSCNINKKVVDQPLVDIASLLSQSMSLIICAMRCPARMRKILITIGQNISRILSSEIKKI